MSLEDSRGETIDNDLLAVAQRLQEFCESRRWRFCFIGGLAVQWWSEPRLTDDVDLTLITGFGGEESYIDALLGLDWLMPRIPNAREIAHSRRVLLLQSKNGVGVDIALGAFPFEELAAQRAGDFEMLPGIKLRLCTAEDLIVFKSFAARAQDWRDVEMTIVRQGDETLDWDHIFKQLAPLVELKEQPELLDQLEALRARLKRTS